MENELVKQQIRHAKRFLRRGYPVYSDLVSKTLSSKHDLPIEDLRHQIGLSDYPDFTYGKPLFYCFINSMPRSGSTAYRQSLFKSHPNICIFAELFKVGTVYSHQDFDFEALRITLSGSKSDATTINWSNEEKALFHLEEFERRYKRFIKYEANTSRFLIGDKRPYLFKSMSNMINKFPTKSLKIIHILRNEFDIVASGLKRKRNLKDKSWKQDQDMEYLVENYNLFLNELENCISSERYKNVHNIYVDYNNMFSIPNVMSVARELTGSLDSAVFSGKVIGNAQTSEVAKNKSKQGILKRFTQRPRLTRLEKNFIRENINYELKNHIQDHLKIEF